MDLTSAVEYLAAIIVIVAAGAVLGATLRRRPQNPQLRRERVNVYSEVIGLMDGLRMATAAHKRHFVDAYYQALLYAPDSVLSSLNKFVQAVTQPDEKYDSSAAMEARDAAVRAMRVDTQAQFQLGTTLPMAELFSIEVSDSLHWQATSTPDEENLTSTEEPAETSGSDHSLA
jgi:hypothetical protein